MAKTTKEDERKFILECIEVYRELPCLWNITSADYSNRCKKEAAYSTLLSKYQERYENATKEDVKKKFNSLRTNFRKEVKKISQSERSGAGTDDLYESSLWYYDAMLFLRDQEMDEPSRSSLSSASKAVVHDGANQPDYSIDAPESDTGSTPSNQVLESNKIKMNKKRSFNERRDQMMSLVCKRLQSDETDDDGIMSMVKAWVHEPKQMKEDQKLFAKKAINDILFEGRLGTLHRNSVQINEVAHHSLVHTPLARPLSSASSLSPTSYSNYSHQDEQNGQLMQDNEAHAQGNPLANYFSSFVP